MKIVEFSTRRPVTVFMFFVAVAIFGLISFSNLAVDLLPNITYPTLTIRTEYPGSSPAEVESLISTKIENAVGIVGGVIDIHSSSRAGVSDVIVEFDWGTNMDFASIDIRENLETVQLPSDAEKPRVLRFDPLLDPIMRISLSGDDNMVELRQTAQDTVLRGIEGIEGVASVVVSGGVEEEIQIEIDESRLAARGISLSQVISRLAQENVNITGGSLTEAGSEYLVRVLNQFVEVDEIGSVVVGEVVDQTTSQSTVVRLAEVADVVRGVKDTSVIHRTNGVQSVELAVYKEAAANTVSVAGLVGDEIAGMADALQSFSGLSLLVVFDQAEFIRLSIREVINTALWGGLLAIVVLFLFIREVRSTSIISIAIPISVVATFFFMFASGVSLNIMSLGGLALGIGMLVDNSIVVLESVNRHTDAGMSRLEAANTGASEVGRAVSAATFTTICVFIPVVFVRGIAGQLFTDPALTVTFSLLASLALALTLIPMLYSLGGKSDKATPQGAKPGRVILVISFPFRVLRAGVIGIGRAIGFILKPLFILFDYAYRVIARVYPSVLKWALSHKLVVLTVAVLIFGLSILLLPFLGTELIPEVSRGEFAVDVETPVGTPVETTDGYLQTMGILAAEIEEADLTYSIAGASGTAGTEEAKEHVGLFSVVLRDGIRGKAESDIIEDMRTLFADLPGVSLSFGRPPLFTFDSPIEVAVKGYDLELLSTVSEELSVLMSTIPGVVDVRSSAEAGSPEIRIMYDRRRLSDLGLDIQTVAGVIRDKVQGEVATEFESGDRKIDVRVRAREEDRRTSKDLERLVVATKDGIPITLGSVASIEVKDGPAEIRRESQERAAVITANLMGRDLGSVITDIESASREIDLPPDFSVVIGGQRQEMAVSFESLRFAILLAVLLVYLVMAAQFESLLHPLIILFSIPFGLSGVILILYLTNTAVSVIALIGVVVMAGIVVNNAIVLVDFINRLRRSGTKTFDAVMEAGKVRLRPILMTTATTVLALIPMSVTKGEGWEIRAPLALTVVGGLLFSTMVTLLLIPTVYAAFYRKERGGGDV